MSWLEGIEEELFAAFPLNSGILDSEGAFSGPLSHQNQHWLHLGETHFPSDGAVLAFSGNILPLEEKISNLRGRGVPTILTDSWS